MWLVGMLQLPSAIQKAEMPAELNSNAIFKYLTEFFIGIYYLHM
jgi:hypothetical protein